MLSEANAIVSQVASDVGVYKRTAGIPVREDVNIYSFPSDIIRLESMNLDGSAYGRVVVSTTYQDALVQGSISPNDGASYWGFTPTSYFKPESPVYYRDTVSYDEFRIEPALTAEDVFTVEPGGVTWTP